MRLKRTFALLFLATAPLALADGGIALGQFRGDGLLVTVFAAPVPIRAGPLDVTFLVQELPSNQPVTDATILCSVERTGPPSSAPVRLPAWCSTIPPGTRVPATDTHSKNKLLRGAYLPVTEPGPWQLRADVAAGARNFSFQIPFVAAPPRQPISVWWPLIALVPAGILIYAWRAALLKNKGSRITKADHE